MSMAAENATIRNNHNYHLSLFLSKQPGKQRYKRNSDQSDDDALH